MRKYESIRPLDGANGDLEAAWRCRMDDVTSRGAKKPGRRARASRCTECLLRCKLLPCSVLFCPNVPPAVTPGRSNIRSYKTCTSAPSERSPRSNLTSLRPASVANATRNASAHTLGEELQCLENSENWNRQSHPVLPGDRSTQCLLRLVAKAHRPL